MPDTIINLNTTPPTATQLLAANVNQQQQMLQGQFLNNLRIFNQVKDFVWNNKNYTPQQVLNQYGTKAADLFKLSGAFVAMIYAYTGQVPEVVPAGTEYTINTDGSITITASSSSSSSAVSSSSSSSSVSSNASETSSSSSAQ